MLVDGERGLTDSFKGLSRGEKRGCGAGGVYITIES